MSGVIPRTDSYWDLVARNLVMGRTPIISTTAGVAVTYVITHNGTTYLSGSMTYQSNGYENAWVKRFRLPSTPGTLTAVVTVTATIDSATVVGTLQSSIRVVQA